MRRSPAILAGWTPMSQAVRGCARIAPRRSVITTSMMVGWAASRSGGGLSEKSLTPMIAEAMANAIARLISRYPRTRTALGTARLSAFMRMKRTASRISRPHQAAPKMDAIRKLAGRNTSMKVSNSQAV